MKFSKLTPKHKSMVIKTMIEDKNNINSFYLEMITSYTEVFFEAAEEINSTIFGIKVEDISEDLFLERFISKEALESIMKNNIVSSKLKEKILDFINNDSTYFKKIACILHNECN